MKMEDHPAFSDKLPRICYLIGTEENPVKIGEHFGLEYGSDLIRKTAYFVDGSGSVVFTNSIGERTLLCAGALCEILNHPEKIIRRPQFSEDEKALMRLLVSAGLPWVARDKEDGCLFAYADEPENGDPVWEAIGKNAAIPDEFFLLITFENSPFDAAAYLESEAQK